MNENHLNKLSKIESLLLGGILEEPTLILLDLTKDNFKQYYKEARLIRSDFSRAKRDKLRNHLTREEFSVLESNLASRALDICQAISNIMEIQNSDNQSYLNKSYINYVDSDKETKRPNLFHVRKSVVKVEHLKYKFRNFALKDITFDCKEGEIIGVIGENASGKTTLLRILNGVLKLNSGSLSYPFFDSIDVKGWFQIKKNIAVVPQVLPKWYGNLKDNLHHSAAIHGIYKQENIEEVEYIIARLRLNDMLDKKWTELSGGYKMRFALAKALIWKPKLLILDEPLANLDIKAQNRVLHDLKSFAERYNLCIILSSQHLNEVELIADNILCLQNGTAIFFGKKEEIGVNRKENLFEFFCSLDYEDLKKQLGNSVIGFRTFIPPRYIISTPLECDYAQTIGTLVNKKVPFTNFNDISHSVKSFFYE